MNDRRFLIWIHERLQHHGDDELCDYMHKLRAIVLNTSPDSNSVPGGFSGNTMEELVTYLVPTPDVSDAGIYTNGVRITVKTPPYAEQLNNRVEAVELSVQCLRGMDSGIGYRLAQCEDSLTSLQRQVCHLESELRLIPKRSNT
jgi:hypothetical protein